MTSYIVSIADNVKPTTPPSQDFLRIGSKKGVIYVTRGEYCAWLGYYKRHYTGNFVCKPPESCFVCPHPDCIASVNKRRTESEKEYIKCGIMRKDVE
jgi:hypothetical protein